MGEGWAKSVRSIKESTPEIIVALYANYLGCKLKKKNSGVFELPAGVESSGEHPLPALRKLFHF